MLQTPCRVPGPQRHTFSAASDRGSLFCLLLGAYALDSANQRHPHCCRQMFEPVRWILRICHVYCLRVQSGQISLKNRGYFPNSLDFLPSQQNTWGFDTPHCSRRSEQCKVQQQGRCGAEVNAAIDKVLALPATTRAEVAKRVRSQRKAECPPPARSSKSKPLPAVR